jgi:site-specific recombinase XerD
LFATAAGTALDRHNVLLAFRPVVRQAGLDPSQWTLRELRHSFVSLLSDSGMSIKGIADLCGHSGTTEGISLDGMCPLSCVGTAGFEPTTP